MATSCFFHLITQIQVFWRRKFSTWWFFRKVHNKKTCDSVVFSRSAYTPNSRACSYAQKGLVIKEQAVRNAQLAVINISLSIICSAAHRFRQRFFVCVFISSFLLDIDFLHKFLTFAFKTESARTSSSYWTKLCTKIIYTLLQAFVLLQKKSFLTTPNIENQFRSSAEFPLNHLKDVSFCL